VLAQSPYRPQYMDSGTTFIADVQEPLSFGSEQLKAEALTNIGSQPPAGSLVHAWLTTPLSSATSKRGDPAEAVISQPLVVSDQLFLPEGSRLKGSVLEVRPARRLGRNGQLRITFHQVVPTSGIEEEVEATLKGVDATKNENLKLDSEGGAQVTTPKTRYLTTGIAVMLAASSAAPDEDRDGGGGSIGGGAARGASGFKLLGQSLGPSRIRGWWPQGLASTGRGCLSIRIFWREDGMWFIPRICRWCSTWGRGKKSRRARITRCR